MSNDETVSSSGAKLVPQDDKKSSLEFTVHPPERRRKSNDVVAHCCCCCCCCCLHSLGSIIGAAVSAAKTARNVQARTAVSIYWISLCVLTLITGLFFVSDQGAMILVLLLCIPGIQLGASVISLIGVLVKGGPDMSPGLAAIGKITLWTFLGTVAGILIMILIGVVMGMR